MDDDLLVLLEHSVHRVPVEGDEPSDGRCRIRRVLIGIGRVRCLSVAGADRPVRSLAHRRLGSAAAAGGLEQLGAHVLFGEQVRRSPVRWM